MYAIINNKKEKGSIVIKDIITFQPGLYVELAAYPHLKNCREFDELVRMGFIIKSVKPVAEITIPKPVVEIPASKPAYVVPVTKQKLVNTVPVTKQKLVNADIKNSFEEGVNNKQTKAFTPTNKTVNGFKTTNISVKK